MDPYEQEDAAERKRRTIMIVVGVIASLGVAGGVAKVMTNGDKPVVKKKSDPIVTIVLPPPPPLPPPPTLPPKPEIEPPKQEMVKETVQEEEAKPDDAKPADAGPPDPGLPQGNGDSGFGGGGHGGGGGGGGHGGGGGTARKYYASQVAKGLKDAMKQNPKVRTASVDVTAAVWLDRTGQVTRVKLNGDVKPEEARRALEQDVISTFSGPGAPPADMPMPLNLRLRAVRP